MAVAAQKDNWRNWYDSIIDWMIANPGRTQRECARDLKRGETTISLIVNSDTFKAHYAKRRREWEEMHDASIIHKTQKVAQLGLDGMLEKLDKGRDKLPLGQLVDVTEKALARLGYGVQPQKLPGVTVNVGAGAGSVVSVDKAVLSEARQNLRAVQAQRVEDAVVIKEEPPKEGEAAEPQKPEELA